MITLTFNQKIFVLLSMIFLHIFDDYVLQGILKQLKQKDWWREQKSYSFIYENDYKMALLCHSFSWTFMVMLPLFVVKNFNASNVMIGYFIINVCLHYNIDDLKANYKRINLIQDQCLHLLQVLLTWCLIFNNTF